MEQEVVLVNFIWAFEVAAVNAYIVDSHICDWQQKKMKSGEL